MTLGQEFKDLCERWRDKARSHDTGQIEGLYDKFISLYIVYNALYVETAVYLCRKDREEGKDGYKLENGSFPDKAAATKYVLDLLKSGDLMKALKSDALTCNAIEQLIAILSGHGETRFWIFLDPVYGEPRKEEDKKLLKGLRSSSADSCAQAVLQCIYEVRCNMFHGRKGVDPVQMELLIPLTVLLEKIIDKLFSKLDTAP